MKKVLTAILAAAMALSLLSGCAGSKPTETTSPDKVEGTMEELLNEIVAQQPVEFDGGVETIDLTDTSEEGQWAIKSSTGLDNAGVLTEAAVFEPMIGSIAFSMVMVRVAPGEDIKSVAEAMKSGINPRKWVCVEADDMLVTGYRDVVMLIMLDTSYDLTAQSFVLMRKVRSSRF